MYDEFLNFIFPLAKGAGEIQLAYFRGDDLGIETKSNAYDVVTRADKESEAYIVQAILGRYPGHGILGEVGGVMGTAGGGYPRGDGPPTGRAAGGGRGESSGGAGSFKKKKKKNKI